MDEELCNDGKCPRYREGEGRHPLHIKKKRKKEMEKVNVPKELTKIQVKATFDASVGSVIASFGIALIVLGVALDIDSIVSDQLGTYLRVLSNAYVIIGFIAFVVGLSLILVKEFLINRRINKLYKNDS